MIRVRSQKIISKLSKKSLQTNRVRNMVAVSAIALTTLLFTALFTITETMLYTSEQQTFRQVGGSFHGGFKNLTLEQKELLEQDDGIKESGSRLMLGRAAGEEFRKVHAEISYMDENYRKYGFCTPEYGREPQEGTKQIACDTRILKCLGIEPEIGRQVTMTYEIGGLNKEEITDTFVLSGWWEFDAASSASMAIVSKSYVDTVIMKHPVDFTDDANATGTWSLDVFFDSSRHIEQDLLQILDSHGYQAEDQMKENYIGIGVNWGYAAAQMSEKYDVEMIAGSAALVVLIVMTGYLIIYNIFQISVIQDIQTYGQLKTLGTTKRQIKKMINRQAVKLSMIGVPIGLLIGFFLGRALVPFLMNGTIYTADAGITVTANPLIFIGAAAFAIFTVLISVRKPAKIAGTVSPIEAILFTENDGTAFSGKKSILKKSTHGAKIHRMALANLGRNRKRTVLVIVSMTLSLVLFNTVFTFASGFDIDKYIAKFVNTDFVISTADYFQFQYETSSNDLSESFVESVKDSDCFEAGGRLYATRMLEEAFSAENDAFSNYNTDENDNPLIDLYGADDFLLKSMEIIEGTIDWQALKTGKYVLLNVECDDNGNMIDNPDVKVGDTIRFNHVSMDGLSSASDNHFELIVMAKVAVNENTATTRNTGMSRFYMPTENYLPLCTSPHLVSFPFNVEDGTETQMKEFLDSYVKDIEPSMDFDCKETYVSSFENLTSLIITIGGALSIVIGFIGIVNFVNSVLTSIITRRKEFAMLQSIGMTGKQLRKLISFEGLYYSLGTIFASVVFGTLFSVIIVKGISDGIWFFTYHFVMWPMLVIYPCLIILTVLIPALLYKLIGKTSIIERLRQN